MPQIVPFDKDNVAYGIAMGKELHDLGSFKDVPFDHDYTRNMTVYAIHQPDWFLRIAKDDDGNHVGIMVGRLDTFLFSPRLLATECMLYVREGTKSRARIAMMLIKAFTAWAKDKGATHVQAGDVAGINSLAAWEVYRRCGFERFGILYKYSEPGSLV